MSHRRIYCLRFLAMNGSSHPYVLCRVFSLAMSASSFKVLFFFFPKFHFQMLFFKKKNLFIVQKLDVTSEETMCSIGSIYENIYNPKHS